MKQYILYLFAVVLIGAGGCKKLIEVEPSVSQLLEEEVYKDSGTIQSAIAGLYSTIAFNNFSPYNGQISVLGGFSADELGFIGNNNDQFINNALLPDNSAVASIWRTSYSTIYVANSIIEGINNAGNISTTFRDQAAAEARLIRAFCHFYLVNFFGDVPLITGTDVQANATTPRTAAADVYDAILADVLYAQSILPADYSVSGNERTRVNRWVATAFLARVYLYLGEWENAEAQATAVINSPLFTLPTNLSQVFSTISTEAIWQLHDDGSGFTAFAEEVLPNPQTNVPGYVLTPQLVSALDSADQRKTEWTSSLEYNGSLYTYLTKYKSVITGANAEYYTVFRLAEQYLIRAEARAQRDNLSGAEADLLAVRSRAGNLPLPGMTTKAEALMAIEQERRLELFGEWAHRWLDLKRTGRANAVLEALKPGTWKPTAAMYPIPATQIAANANLTQNPGYN